MSVFWRRLWSDPLGRIGIILTVIVVLVAAVAPWAAPHDPFHQFSGRELRAPGGTHPLGTDEFGRDLLSRVLHGARLSLAVGVLAVLVGGGLGLVAGLAAGYRGGWIDSVVMRVSDTVLAFPPILIGIAIGAALGPGWLNGALAAGLANMPAFARITRAAVLSERARDYVIGALASGASDRRILFAHIFPNVLSPVLVQAAVAMANAVLLEAGLSFIGLGAQPPQPSWGSMLSAARPYLRQAPWYAIFPGIAIACALIGMNFLSDAVRNLIDPRQRRLS